MEDNANIMDALTKRALEYAKTSYELIKLKALDKTLDIMSSMVSSFIFIILIILFIFILNIGIALWLGGVLGKPWYGFFILAAFYGIIEIVVYFFMRKCLKKSISNFIIKKVLK
jgi:uncharacterized membrane protein